ncbi:1817_t:CDS:2 [Dentiscutata heterogama]|uniref:1817_t:CDS:1 n=1 Tax=Dentiscutata heterogama TaxID=1316150 RepID=A0ACA9MNE2_9GLOM|nr:1817_t:CDS:2 [Dentiscutata heterogama]
MPPQHKLGRKTKPIWQWFSKGEKLNSSHYLAQCNFCKQNCSGEPSKMAKYLLLICEEIHQDKLDNNLLLQVDNYNDNCNDLSKVKNTLVLSIGEKASINYQLLKALILANAPLLFVEDPEVIKLFHMLKSEYKLPSCKWLSTDILDKIYEKVQCSIQHFISDSMFLTLSGDGWTNVSKNGMLNFIITNEKHKSQILKIDNYSDQHHTSNNIFAIYKEIEISLGLNKWIAFISDSGPDFKKVQRLMREVIAFIHTSYLISCSQGSDIIIDIINNSEFWLKLELFYKLLKPYDYVIKILETEKATLGQVAASWAWLHGIVDKSSFTNNDFKDSLIIEIDNY